MFEKLQNGSDVRGTAVETENEKADLTKNAVICIAQAFADWLKKKTGKEDICTAVGRDSRITGPDILSWTCDGLSACGAKVFDFGLASTPAMFMSTVFKDWDLDGSVMVTASHLPFQKNGMKFFTKNGGLEKEDIAAILSKAGQLSADVRKSNPVKADFMKSYTAYLRKKICEGVCANDYEHPLKDYHIVVDAGNGAGGFFARDILVPLGADISGSRYLEPDGHFPNHIPNPENETAMASIVDAVKTNHADLGIIFDTDVDRAGAVLSSGEELNRNRLIAAMSSIVLKTHPGTTVVTDSVTSTGLAEFISAHGGKHLRFKRGYRNVINESIRLNNSGTDSQLAMETSGHGALKENYFMDDGAYLCIKLLIELGCKRKLKDLVSGLREPEESAEVRLHFTVKDYKTSGDNVLNYVKDEVKNRKGWTIAKDNYEGIRVNISEEQAAGWFLLRMSLHEPLMPLNIESDNKGGVAKIASEILTLLKKQPCLDTEPLEKIL